MGNKYGSNVESIKIFWKHNHREEPVVIFYEIALEKERLAIRSIDIFSDRTTKNIDDLYEGAIEIVPIPTVEEFNSGTYGEEFSACSITSEEFERVWSSHIYYGDLSANGSDFLYKAIEN